MNPEVIVALTTLVGVLVSVTVSLVISARNTNTELRKLKSELQRRYASKLTDKRLEVYPSLYFATSSFLKRVRRLDQPVHEVELKVLSDFLSDVEAWDSRNSIYLSTHAMRQLSELRLRLETVVSGAEERHLTKVDQGFDSYAKVLQDTEDLEFAIRSDIAVFELDIANVSSRIRTFVEQENKIR